MARRLVRLEPPYLVSIAIVIAIGAAAAATPWFKGPPPDYSLTQIASHLGYLNAYLGKGWLNPVYWSLAIEFQYYVLIGLAFPALVGGNAITRLVAVTALAAAPLLMPLSGSWFVSAHLPIFCAGILTFLLAMKLIPNAYYALAMAALALYLQSTRGTTLALATVAPALIIASVRMPHIGPIAWLGTVSYSVYLLHAPIGTRIVNMGARFGITTARELIVVTAALVASFAAAYTLHVFIEQPAQAMAKKISYAPTDAPPVRSSSQP